MFVSYGSFHVRVAYFIMLELEKFQMIVDVSLIRHVQMCGMRLRLQQLWNISSSRPWILALLSLRVTDV
jgi:hypothetical protein